MNAGGLCAARDSVEVGLMAESYVCGVSDAPLIYQTIGGALDAAAERFAERPALIVRHQNIRLSYAGFSAAVDDFAAGLLALGLSRGDRIGIWSPNNAEWVIAQFATARLGLILVNINPAYRTAELEYVLNKVGARALILAKSFKTSDYVGMVRSLGAEKLPHLEEAIVIANEPIEGFKLFKAVSALATDDLRARVREIGAGLSPDDPINIQFTSGTTGFPKGATLTHHNIVNNGRFVAARQQFTEEDRLCIPVPLYHCFGMVMGVLGCVTHGAAMVFPDEAFDPESVLDAVERERCTALYGVPTMFIAELDHPTFKGRDLSSLRTGVMAGAPCPEPIMRRVISDMHMKDVTICYGMTETSPVSFQSMPDDDLEKRVTTVGAIHPYVEVKIIDVDGKMTERGVQGELLTRGYSVMRGYWGDPEKTEEAIDDGGWMHTGDLAVLDEDGYCRITGRVKDMIIRGGENVYPREIEEFLFRHPAVQDVQVFGVPDEKYGEEVCAWIRLRVGEAVVEEEIRAFCKERIAHYKVPRYVRFVEDFPMTVTGKVQKFVMRDAMTAELSAPKQRVS